VKRGGSPVKSATVGDRDEAAQRCDIEHLGHTPNHTLMSTADQSLR
jgi:hypothetical protein